MENASSNLISKERTQFLQKKNIEYINKDLCLVD